MLNEEHSPQPNQVYDLLKRFSPSEYQGTELLSKVASHYREECFYSPPKWIDNLRIIIRLSGFQIAQSSPLFSRIIHGAVYHSLKSGNLRSFDEVNNSQYEAMPCAFGVLTVAAFQDRSNDTQLSQTENDRPRTELSLIFSSAIRVLEDPNALAHSDRWITTLKSPEVQSLDASPSLVIAELAHALLDFFVQSDPTFLNGLRSQ